MVDFRIDKLHSNGFAAIDHNLVCFFSKGVTFLAFGNGAPDIFSSLAGIAQSRPELVIGELFGKQLFHF